MVGRSAASESNFSNVASIRLGIAVQSPDDVYDADLQNKMVKQLGFVDENDQKKIDETSKNQRQRAMEQALENIIPVDQTFAPLGPIFSDLNEWPSGAILDDAKRAAQNAGLSELSPSRLLQCPNRRFDARCVLCV